MPWGRTTSSRYRRQAPALARSELGTGSPEHLVDYKTLGIAVAALGAPSARQAPETLLVEVRSAPELALVATQGVQLPVQGPRDVDEQARSEGVAAIPQDLELEDRLPTAERPDRGPSHRLMVLMWVPQEHETVAR